MSRIIYDGPIEVVIMTGPMAGPVAPGDVRDVPEEEAERLVKGGQWRRPTDDESKGLDKIEKESGPVDRLGRLQDEAKAEVKPATPTNRTRR